MSTSGDTPLDGTCPCQANDSGDDSPAQLEYVNGSSIADKTASRRQDSTAANYPASSPASRLTSGLVRLVTKRPEACAEKNSHAPAIRSAPSMTR